MWFERLTGFAEKSPLNAGLKSPVCVKHGDTERFYVRSAAATRELLPSEPQTHIDQRF